jgi:hypothetical protein
MIRAPRRPQGAHAASATATAAIPTGRGGARARRERGRAGRQRPGCTAGRAGR